MKTFLGLLIVFALIQLAVPQAQQRTSPTPDIVVNEEVAVGDGTVLDWPDDQDRHVVPAIEAVKRWRYKPGSLNGKPAKVSIHVEVVFEP